MAKESIMKMDRRRALKADFHLHTAEDPVDSVRYTAKELIEKAADEGFDVLSITNHQQMTFDQDLFFYAKERGILLIPGMEMTIQKRHVLVSNPPLHKVCSDFFSLSKLRRPETLIVAPHPYFPGPTSLNGYLLKHLNLFDALEYSHFYSPMITFNQKVVSVSQSYGLPLVGTSDAHLFSQIGSTHSLIYVEKNLEAVFAAIRHNMVEVISRPLKHLEMGWIATRLLKMRLPSIVSL
jgi:predicted metal-dependent phosphoesterase TrpH